MSYVSLTELDNWYEKHPDATWEDVVSYIEHNKYRLVVYTLKDKYGRKRMDAIHIARSTNEYERGYYHGMCEGFKRAENLVGQMGSQRYNVCSDLKSIDESNIKNWIIDNHPVSALDVINYVKSKRCSFFNIELFKNDLRGLYKKYTKSEFNDGINDAITEALNDFAKHLNNLKASELNDSRIVRNIKNKIKVNEAMRW